MELDDKLKIGKEVSREVPTATDPSHAVPLSQMQEAIAAGRTEKLISNTTQYTILATDVDKLLKFTANAGEEIQLIYNENTLPDVNKSIVAMSTGNNILIPTVGTGSVTFGVPAGSLLKTTGENSLITLQPKGSVNDLAVWGSLEGVSKENREPKDASGFPYVFESEDKVHHIFTESADNEIPENTFSTGDVLVITSNRAGGSRVTSANDHITSPFNFGALDLPIPAWGTIFLKFYNNTTVFAWGDTPKTHQRFRDQGDGTTRDLSIVNGAVSISDPI